MVKAMYSGVAGLKAHQSKMDVIGNNIANVNTWGYKSMDTSFKESIYSIVNAGSAGSTSNGSYGGTNPSVVGYGSMVSAISANFTSGNQVPTGKSLDLYIDGTAFFAVGPMYGEGEAKNPSDIFLSRVGDFGVVNGFLVDSNGRYIYGSSMTTGGEVYNPKATSSTEKEEITLAPPTADAGFKVTRGNAKYIVYNKEDKNNVLLDKGKMNRIVYKANAFSAMDDQAILADTEFGAYFIANPPATAGTLTAAEILAAVTAYNAANSTTDPETSTYRYELDPADATGKTIIKLKRDDNLSEINTDIPLPDSQSLPPEPDGTTVSITYEYVKDKPGLANKITTTVTPKDPDAVKKGPQFDDGRLTFDAASGSYNMGSVGTLKPLKMPTSCTYYDEQGRAQTENDIVFETFTIQQNGMIYGTSAKSSRSYLLGCVGLVNVDNPSGMQKADGPYYKLGASSGEGTVVQPGGDTGKLNSGYLESANVDIATEFSSMITTQRGFQANSKIITVTDEMLQELVNMKR